MAEYEYAEITGRVGWVVGDSSDPGREPDVVYPDVGSTAIIEALQPYVLTERAGEPITLGTTKITCEVGPDGLLRQGGTIGAWVVDLGGPGVNPVTPRDRATYRVTYFVKLGDVKMTLPTFTFHPVAGQVNDLSKMTPLPTGTGQLIARGEDGTGVASLDVEGNHLTYTLTDNTVGETPLPAALVESDAQVAAAVVAGGPTTAALSATFARVHGVDPAVGNGTTNAGPAIQAALAAAAAEGGGTVFLPAGQYRIATPMTISSHTTLHLDAAATIVRDMAGNVLTTAGDGTAGGYGQVSDVTLRGGTWSSNGSLTSGNFFATAHGSGITIEDANFTANGGSWHYIEINSTEQVRILRCTFDQPSGAISEMVQLDYAGDAGSAVRAPYDDTPCRDVLIDGCHFSSPAVVSGRAGIGTHQRKPGTPMTGIRITRCTFRGLFPAIRPGDWTDFVTEGNTFTDNWAALANLDSGNFPAGARNWTISNNTIRAKGLADSRGIQLYGGVGEIQLEGVTISNNTISGVSTYGIKLEEMRGLTITGNSLSDIDDPTLNSTGSGGGIWASRCQRVTIASNAIQSNAGHASGQHNAMLIGVSSGTPTTGVCITGNRIDGRAVNIVYTAGCVMTGNLIELGVNTASNTDYNAAANRINGAWVP